MQPLKDVLQDISRGTLTWANNVFLHNMLKKKTVHWTFPTQKIL